MEENKEKYINIIKRNHDRLKRLCRVYAENDDDRKDLYQEILVQVWRSLSQFRGDSSIDTWLYRIALNVSVSHLRKEKTRRDYYKKFQKERINLIVDESPEKIKIEDEEIDQLYEAINSLNLSEKAVITLYLEELSYADIASVVGISENYVGVKLNRIKSKMSQYIDDHYGIRKF